jgi:hypothetical protein
MPVTYQWNVAIERALGRSNAVSVSYVAAAGRGPGENARADLLKHFGTGMNQLVKERFPCLLRRSVRPNPNTSSKTGYRG